MEQNRIGIKEMARKLFLPVSWLYGKTRTGEIPHYKIGKYVRFDADQVMEWIRSQNQDERNTN